MKTRKVINENGARCYLVFSKTSNSFLKREIDLFKSILSETQDIILFTAAELEPYEPYENYGKDKKIHRHVFNLEQAVFNSTSIYLQ